MVLGDVDLASTYFMQRLHQTRQAQRLPARSQFNLARSPLSDDELEEIVDQFRDSPRPREGWGIAPMLGEVLSREPKSIPVNDLRALQNNLIASGYAPPDARATGEWDPSWYAALRRFDRDNLEAQRAGRHWYSAPVEAGVRALSNTLPSRVWQGLVGGAKGVVMQAPETAERVGLAGGALTGAGIGAAIGGPFGAGAGALLGGLIGFGADFFGDDEGEEDQSFANRFLDALSPWDEYRAQGPKAFWEDVGFVASAASIASGVGLAARGAGAAVAGMQAARLTPAAGAVTRPVVNSMMGVRSAGQIGGRVVGEELVSKGSWVRAALQPARAAGQTELGVMGTLTRAAARRTAAPGSVTKLEHVLQTVSPVAFAQRLGPQVVQKAFAGASQASMGPRVFGGLGAGSSGEFVKARDALEAEIGRDLTEEELLELSKKTSSTAIEKAIANTDPLLTGMELPLIGDIVDVAAFMFYPEKLLPFGSAAVGKSATKLLGDTSLYPFIHAHMAGRRVSLAQARAEVREKLDGFKVAWYRTDFGIHQEAARMVERAYRGNARLASKRGAMANARADLIREFHAADDAGKRVILDRWARHSVVDEEQFTRWLIDLDAQGSGLDKADRFWEASRLSRNVEREVGERMRYVRDENGDVVSAEAWLPVPERVETFQTGAGPVKLPVRQERVSVGGVRKTGTSRQTDISAIDASIAQLENRVGRYESFAGRTRDPFQTIAAQERVRLTRSEIASLKKTRDDLKRGLKTEVQPDRFKIAPARRDFIDRQDFAQMREEFLRLRDEVINAPTENARVVARQSLANFVEDVQVRVGIDDKVAASALRDKPSKDLANELHELGQGAASRVQLPEHHMAEFERLGYKPVAVGDDVLFPDELGGLIETTNVGTYTKRAALVESLGMSPRWRSDKNLFQLRRAHENAEVSTVLDKHGIKLTPGRVFERLHKHLDSINHEGAVFGPVRKGKTGRPTLYKVDTRDLTPDEILNAFEDVPGFHDGVARDLYGALRKGAAYGGEVRLLHPVESARSLAMTMRLNGLPGFSDVLRATHADVPGRLNRSAWRQGRFTYRPAAEVARSPHRKSVETALRKTAANTQITDGQWQVGMAMLDSMVLAQVKAGRFDNVDDAFRHLDVAYAERYVPEDYPAAYFRRIQEQPEHEELRLLAEAYADEREWYEKGAAALAKLPFHGRTTLNDGREIGDLELYTNILAAVSPRTGVENSVELANKAFLSIKRGDEQWPTGLLPAVRGMLDDIVAGRTVDTWGPAREIVDGKARINHTRQKVENFYQNLSGDLDRVTNDSWMAKLFGYDGTLTASQYDDITAEVRALADDLGWKPAQVQAALWGAVREEAATPLLVEAAQLSAKGQVKRAAELREEAHAVMSMDSFDTFTPRIEEMLAGLNGHALLRSVDAKVQGLTQFGPDFTAIMRFFKTADFETLAHENGHLLRMLLPEEDLAQLERAYGVRVAKAPEGVSDDLRAIADEYHETAGIPRDRTALEEYADVDEERAKRIADAFEQGKPTPRDKETREAYVAFAEETMAQYRLLVSKGYKLIPWAGEGQPYKNAAEFIKDVRENKRIYYFKTLQDDAFGAGKITKEQIAENPLLASSGVKVLDSAGNAYEQTYNDVFRAVHDIFGHAKEGLQTGARGEENAWRQHARMYSSKARRAMTTETRGQNSWVNFGPQMRAIDVEPATIGRYQEGGGSAVDQAIDAANKAGDDFAYHTTEVDNLPSIARRGIQPDAEGQVFVAATPRDLTYAAPHAGRAPKRALLRVKGSALDDADMGDFPGEGVLEAAIDAKDVEILGKDGQWHPLRLGRRLLKKGDPGFLPPQARDFSEQKVMLLPEEFSRVETALRWPREAEERFARDAERYIMGKTQPGHSYGAFGALRDATRFLWHHTRGAATEYEMIPRSVRKLLDKHFPLPEGMAPPTRKAVLARDLASKQAAGGAAVGAGLGAIEGDEGLEDIIRGAVMGGAAGLVGRQALKRTYGYLPDALSRMNTALRFTLSFTFDLGRYTEQNMIAMSKHGLPPMLKPVSHIKSRHWKSPFSNGEVTGEAAWQHAIRFWDELNGTSYFQVIDDLDRRMYQAGMLGFSPRNWEAAQAFQLYQRGMGADEIREAVTQIGRYGLGRNAAEKSANFIVFPFSFSKKFLTTLGDFVMQAPARNLLIHEGLRRYHESEFDEKVDDFLERRAPLLRELATINNLAFGISPGRFFLQGLSDHRTAVGKASQLLASFFVPGGSITPLHEAAGNVGDLAIHAFSPVVISGESINRAGGIDSLEDVFRRYVPFVRELDQYFTGEHAAVSRQARALMEGADPFYQFSSYFDELKRVEAAYEPMALALGYQSVNGLMQSDVGMAFAPRLEAEKQAIGQKYPSGFRMAQTFTNDDNINSMALVELAQKADRGATSPAEDQILSLVEQAETTKAMYQAGGLDTDFIASMVAASIRKKAMQFADDPRFAELWQRFFEREYGPIRRVA